MYELAFSFWRLLATEEVKVGNSIVLTNPTVPLLLSNAAWFPEAIDFQNVTAWYTERGITPALIVPSVRDEAFAEALKESAFSLEQAFTFRKLEDPPEHDIDLITEQVSWAQGRVLGEYLAAHYGYPTYGVALGAAITRATQQNPQVISFAAYGADEVAGALVAFEQDSLSAMLMSGVEARLYQEASSRNLPAWVLEPLSKGITFKSEASFERWSVR